MDSMQVFYDVYALAKERGYDIEIKEAAIWYKGESMCMMSDGFDNIVNLLTLLNNDF